MAYATIHCFQRALDQPGYLASLEISPQPEAILPCPSNERLLLLGRDVRERIALALGQGEFFFFFFFFFFFSFVILLSLNCDH